MKYQLLIFFFLVAISNRIHSQEEGNIFCEHITSFQGHDLNYFLKYFVLPNIQYPDSARLNCIKGKVYVQFTVDSIGLISETKIVRSLCYSCDNEAMRVIRLSSGMWSPVKCGGKGINSHFVIPVEYKLKKSECKRQRKNNLR
jgi:TonB family protein